MFGNVYDDVSIASANNARRIEGDTEMTNCKQCKAEIDELAVFPGGICVECYAVSPAGRAPLTAEGVAGMWRGVVRR